MISFENKEISRKYYVKDRERLMAYSLRTMESNATNETVFVISYENDGNNNSTGRRSNFYRHSCIRNKTGSREKISIIHYYVISREFIRSLLFLRWNIFVNFLSFHLFSSFFFLICSSSFFDDSIY